MGSPFGSGLGPRLAVRLPMHPDEHRPERPVLLAVEQQLGEVAGPRLRGLTMLARSREARGILSAARDLQSRRWAPVFVTVTEGRVAPEREDDLRSAWEETASAPAGLIQSTLVRGEDGTWRIITFWESRDAVIAMRASGEPPALTMFHRAGSEPSVSMGTVERQARE